MTHVESRGPDLPDRRTVEPRGTPRLAELPLPEFRRIVITSTLFLVVLGLFLWMVRAVVIAAILGTVIAVYLRPVQGWLEERGLDRRVAGVATLTGAIVPLLAIVVYSYVEVLRVADRLVAREAEITRRFVTQVSQLGGIGGIREDELANSVRTLIAGAADLARDIPALVGQSAGRFSVAAAVLLFTAFYVLTDRDAIAGYLRSHIPGRYAELVAGLSRNVQGVLYGAIFSTLVIQTLKALVVFILHLILGVPLAGLLAIVAFVIGFFPVVGSWTVYLPVAGWLWVFRDDPVGALVLLGVGFVVNTVLLSFVLRPKLAADRSRVLNFYWMFLGLVTGVYTFGLAGLILGPILIGVLKAIWDTVSEHSAWRSVEQEYAR